MLGLAPVGSGASLASNRRDCRDFVPGVADRLGQGALILDTFHVDFTRTSIAGDFCSWIYRPDRLFYRCGAVPAAHFGNIKSDHAFLLYTAKHVGIPA